MENALIRQLMPMASPAYMLMFNNEDITSNIAPRLISLKVTDNRGMAADELELVLDDADGLIEMPGRGVMIRVYIGYKDQRLTDVGDFKIDQVKHHGPPDKVTVTGRSVDFSKQLNVEREASWHETTLGAIVEAIAARNNLKARIDASLAQIKIAHIDQTLESDASFLHRLAVRNGAALAIKWSTLILVKPGRGKGPDGKKFPLVDIMRSDGDAHTFEVTDRTNYGGVVARWLDTKEPKKQTQQVHLQCKPTQQAASATTDPQSATTAQNEKGTTYTAGKKENVYVMSTIFSSQREAEIAAEALWHKIQSNSATFTLTLALGRADITPETPVRVSGFKTVINDTPWVISKVTHIMNNTGFISTLDLEVKVEEGQYDAIQN